MMSRHHVDAPYSNNTKNRGVTLTEKSTEEVKKMAKEKTDQAKVPSRIIKAITRKGKFNDE